MDKDKVESNNEEVHKQEVLAQERDHLCAVTMARWRKEGGVDLTEVQDVFSGELIYPHVRRSMYFIFPDGVLMSCSKTHPVGLELCRPSYKTGANRVTTLSGKLHNTSEPVIKLVAYAFCQNTRRDATDSIKVRFTEPQGPPGSPLMERADNVFFWARPACGHCGQALPNSPGPKVFERVEHQPRVNK